MLTITAEDHGAVRILVDGKHLGPGVSVQPIPERSNCADVHRRGLPAPALLPTSMRRDAPPLIAFASERSGAPRALEAVALRPSHHHGLLLLEQGVHIAAVDRGNLSEAPPANAVAVAARSPCRACGRVVRCAVVCVALSPSLGLLHCWRLPHLTRR